MKIVHINDRFPGFHIKAGGAEQACYDIVDLMHTAGHQNVVLTTKHNNPNYQEKLCQVYALKRMVEFVGYKLSFVARLFWFDPVIYWQTYRFFKKEKPDVVHAQLCEELTLAPVVAAKKLGIPVVLSHYEFGFVCPNFSLLNKFAPEDKKLCRKFSGKHCIDCGVRQGNKLVNYLAHLWRRRIYNWYDKKINHHITLANQWKDILVEYGIAADKIEAVPLPVSNVNYQPEIPVEPNTLIFAGWVKPHKGAWIVVQAMKLVTEKIPTAKFYLIEAGIDDEYKQKMKDFVAQYHLENNVIFLGRKTNIEVKEWLNKTEIGIVADQWEIAWPVILAEMMFYERPTVCAKIGGITEMIDNDRGLLAEYNNPNDFADKIIYLLTHKAEAHAMGQRAREHILKTCDRQVLTKQLINNYLHK